MKRGLPLDVIVFHCVAIFEFLSTENDVLLIWRDARLCMDRSFQALNGIGWFNLDRYRARGDGLSAQRLHVNQYGVTRSFEGYRNSNAKR